MALSKALQRLCSAAPRRLAVRQIHGAIASHAEPEAHPEDLSSINEQATAVSSAPLPKMASSNAAEHKLEDAASIYCMTPEHRRSVAEQMFRHYRLKQMDDFGYAHMVLRRSSLQAIDHLQASLDNKKCNRVMFYGPDFLGKTHCLAHVAHHFHCKGYIVVPGFKVSDWYYDAMDIEFSTLYPDMIDQNMDAEVFLRHMLELNGKHMNELSLQEDITLSDKFVVTAGTKIEEFMSLIEDDNRRACPLAIKALELVWNSPSRPPVVVAIDDANVLFETTTPQSNQLLEPIDLDQNVLLKTFRNMLMLHDQDQFTTDNVVVAAATSTCNGKMPELNDVCRNSIVQGQRLDKGQASLDKTNSVVRLFNFNEEEANSLLAFSNAVGWSNVPALKQNPVFAAELKMLTDYNPMRLNAYLKHR
eukprot:TRINITY_DN4908_c0_g2_i2.p1 TRINITY_DN4908_c0_g2~~TRINITY_DN4908_c0_g2_i2.p1  ORF type:complete len:417 (+),score=75.20 TRINITY_DN4908_c0_g2_i2:59-1309(+)